MKNQCLQWKIARKSKGPGRGSRITAGAVLALVRWSRGSFNPLTAVPGKGSPFPLRFFQEPHDSSSLENHKLERNASSQEKETCRGRDRPQVCLTLLNLSPLHLLGNNQNTIRNPRVSSFLCFRYNLFLFQLPSVWLFETPMVNIYLQPGRSYSFLRWPHTVWLLECCWLSPVGEVPSYGLNPFQRRLKGQHTSCNSPLLPSN